MDALIGIFRYALIGIFRHLVEYMDVDWNREFDVVEEELELHNESIRCCRYPVTKSDMDADIYFLAVEFDFRGYKK